VRGALATVAVGVAVIAMAIAIGATRMRA
jgi:hypothetical protein